MSQCDNQRHWSQDVGHRDHGGALISYPQTEQHWHQPLPWCHQGWILFQKIYIFPENYFMASSRAQGVRLSAQHKLAQSTLGTSPLHLPYPPCPWPGIQTPWSYLHRYLYSFILNFTLVRLSEIYQWQPFYLVNCKVYIYHHESRKVQSNMANLFRSSEEHDERIDDEWRLLWCYNCHWG